jgi:hypothetical protein
MTVVTLEDQTWTKVRGRRDWNQDWYMSWDRHWNWNTRWYWSWIPGWSCLAALWTEPRKPQQPEPTIWFEVEL